MFKRAVFCLLALGSLFSLSSCNKAADFDLGTVLVTIKESSKDDFDNHNILVEDFSWDNISKLNYGEWTKEQNLGYMTVILKSSGVAEVEAAISHFLTLDFIESAQKNYIYNI